jgi:hypothetical protein
MYRYCGEIDSTYKIKIISRLYILIITAYRQDRIPSAKPEDLAGKRCVWRGAT